jgi:hypothetical protein
VISFILLFQNLTPASPAPKANEDTAKEKFYAEIAKAKNVTALGVRVYAIVRCS